LKNIRELVRSIKSKYQTNNPFDIIKSEGIFLKKMDMHKSSKGFYVPDDDKGVIILNTLYGEREQFITAAHELGHYFLHGNSDVLYLRNHTFSVPSKLELEANFFGADLVIDDNVFDEYKDYSMSQITSILGVSEEFVNLKYKGLFL
jgi:Zn-dependent peptidase ImmA (M78 family)